PVAVVRRIKHGVFAIRCEHTIEAGFFGFAGEHDLFALDDIARFALELGHLRREFFDMLIETFSPKRQPARAAFHEADFELRKTIEHAFADHVHHGDHQFKWKRGHVHVDILAKAFAAGAHDAGHSRHAVVAGLRM